MKALPKIVSVSHLQRDAAAILKDVRGSDRPVVVTVSDEAVAVLLDPGMYEDLVESAEPVDEETVVSRSSDDTATLKQVRALVPTDDSFTMADAERAVILDRVQKLSGNRTRAAESLGIGLRTLQRKISHYKRQGFAVPHSAYDDDSA